MCYLVRAIAHRMGAVINEYGTMVGRLVKESRRTRRKICSSITSTTINITLSRPGLNPGLRGEKPRPSRLSYRTASVICSRMKMKKTLLEKSNLQQSKGSNKPSVQTQFGSETYYKKYSLQDFSTIHVDLRQ
jgi:hypothetical protein